MLASVSVTIYKEFIKLIEKFGIPKKKPCKLFPPSGCIDLGLLSYLMAFCGEAMCPKHYTTKLPKEGQCYHFKASNPQYACFTVQCLCSGNKTRRGDSFWHTVQVDCEIRILFLCF